MRVAEATRASIPSNANWPLARRTNKVALRLPWGTNNAMICDCIRILTVAQNSLLHWSKLRAR
jgi:hypothetical protein